MRQALLARPRSREQVSGSDRGTARSIATGPSAWLRLKAVFPSSRSLACSVSGLGAPPARAQQALFGRSSSAQRDRTEVLGLRGACATTVTPLGSAGTWAAPGASSWIPTASTTSTKQTENNHSDRGSSNFLESLKHQQQEEYQ